MPVLPYPSRNSYTDLIIWVFIGHLIAKKQYKSAFNYLQVLAILNIHQVWQTCFSTIISKDIKKGFRLNYPLLVNFCISGNNLVISKNLFLSVTTLIPPACASFAWLVLSSTRQAPYKAAAASAFGSLPNEIGSNQLYRQIAVRPTSN